jgi:hypothetical protein
MTRAIGVAVALAGMLSAATAAAQVKTLTGETQTVTATVEAIEKTARTVTLKGQDGTYEVLYVPRDIKRFDEIKVGDTLRFQYYETITLRPHAPGTKPIDESTFGRTPNAATDKPGGTAAVQRTITATITAIDMNVPSVTFKGPNNWTYSSRVEDKAALAKVKVGDQFDITWTSALVAGIMDAK